MESLFFLVRVHTVGAAPRDRRGGPRAGHSSSGRGGGGGGSGKPCPLHCSIARAVVLSASAMAARASAITSSVRLRSAMSEGWPHGGSQQSYAIWYLI